MAASATTSAVRLVAQRGTCEGGASSGAREPREVARSGGSTMMKKTASDANS